MYVLNKEICGGRGVIVDTICDRSRITTYQVQQAVVPGWVRMREHRH